MSTSSLPGSARIKMLLVPVLAAVFLVQLWPGGEAPPVATAPSHTGETGEARTAESSASRIRLPELRPWPKTDLTAVLQHNPFAVPRVLMPPPPVEIKPPVPQIAVAVPEDEIPVIAPAEEAASPVLPPVEQPVNHAVENVAKQVVQLESKRVSIVLLSPQGASAVVDSKVYRVHDYLEPGVQIAEIRPDAVIVHVQQPGRRPPAVLQELPESAVLPVEAGK